MNIQLQEREGMASIIWQLGSGFAEFMGLGSRSTIEEEPLTKLEGELRKVAEFLPADAIRKFNKENVSVGLDLTRMDATDLNSLFDLMASSFWFDKDVQALFVQHKGSFNITPSPMQPGTSVDEAAEKCYQMASLILKKAPSVMDNNLKIMWDKLRAQFPAIFPPKESTQEMRAWINTDASQVAMQSVQKLELGRSKMQIVPPEVNRISQLSQVYLFEADLGSYPHVFEAHPRAKKIRKNLAIDTFSFSRGPYLLSHASRGI